MLIETIKHVRQQLHSQSRAILTAAFQCLDTVPSAAPSLVHCLELVAEHVSRDAVPSLWNVLVSLLAEQSSASELCIARLEALLEGTLAVATWRKGNRVTPEASTQLLEITQVRLGQGWAVCVCVCFGSLEVNPSCPLGLAMRRCFSGVAICPKQQHRRFSLCTHSWRSESMEAPSKRCWAQSFPQVGGTGQRSFARCAPSPSSPALFLLSLLLCSSPCAGLWSGKQKLRSPLWLSLCSRLYFCLTLGIDMVLSAVATVLAERPRDAQRILPSTFEYCTAKLAMPVVAQGAADRRKSSSKKEVAIPSVDQRQTLVFLCRILLSSDHHLMPSKTL